MRDTNNSHMHTPTPSTMAAAGATGSVWLKVAGLVGASGVALAAYGAHGLKTSDAHFQNVYTRANHQQMYHAALLAVAPFTRRPNLTGGLTLAGIVLFSGSCYTAALTQDRAYGKLAPYGGFSLIAAWLSLLL